jgi:hypothetical protein
VRFTLLDETREVTVDATVAADGVRLAPEVLHDALGWELKPQGLCRGDTCVPVPPSAAPLARQDGVDLATVATLLGRPLALDVEHRVACLGAAAADRAHTLRSLEAPDFTLPDLDGRPYTLSGFRGKKILLVAWASW